MKSIRITVNGEARALGVPARRTLADVLRDDLGLTGTHLGCEQGVCGACTVLVDGEPVRSCLMLGVQADDCAVTTVEGLAGESEGNSVQGGRPHSGAARPPVQDPQLRSGASRRR